MHPRILDERTRTADKRIKEAVKTLAADRDVTAGIERLEKIHDRDPQVKALLQREALADLIEAVTGQPDAIAGQSVEETVPVVRRGRPPLVRA